MAILMYAIVSFFSGAIKKLQQKANLFFGKSLFEKGIYFVQDLLNRDGKFLSLENIQRKYNVQLNYFQIFSAY